MSKTTQPRTRDSVSLSSVLRRGSAVDDFDISRSTSTSVHGESKDRKRSRSAPPLLGRSKDMSVSTASSTSSLVTAAEERLDSAEVLGPNKRSSTSSLRSTPGHPPHWRAARPPIRRLTATQAVIVQAFNWSQSRDSGQVSTAQALLRSYGASWDCMRETIAAERREQRSFVQEHWARARREACGLKEEWESDVLKAGKFVVVEFIPGGLGREGEKWLAELLVRVPAATKDGDNGYVWLGQLVHGRIGIRTWVVEYATAAQATKAASQLRDPVRAFCRASLPGCREMRVHRLVDQMMGRRNWAKSILKRMERMPGAEEAREHVRVRQEREVWVMRELERQRLAKKAEWEIWLAREVGMGVEVEAVGQEADMKRRLFVDAE